MKPEYANTFGIRKVSDKDGEVLGGHLGYRL